MKKRRISPGIRIYFTTITFIGFLLSIGISYLVTEILRWLNIVISVSPIGWILFFSIIFASIVSTFLSYHFAKPYKKICDAMRNVAAGDYKTRIHEEKHIHEINEIYHNFNLMAEELDSTEILKSDFISTVSHEFKTPINAIEGYSMLLQGEDSPEDKRQYVDKILFNTKRLSTLVGNILLLSKVDNQVIKGKQTNFRLDEQLRQAILLLEREWTKKDIEFDIEMESIEYFGSEDILLHVWTNLIGNAIKFDPQGGYIRMRLTKQEQDIIFTIDDNGPGISPEHQKHIFERFYQCDNSHKEEGNGLGLALVKKILDNCDGKIETNNLHPGCRFTVTLPCQPEK